MATIDFSYIEGERDLTFIRSDRDKVQNLLRTVQGDYLYLVNFGMNSEYLKTNKISESVIKAVMSEYLTKYSVSYQKIEVKRGSVAGIVLVSITLKNEEILELIL